jgi:nucleotide-binding universal stress UspA family protein
MALKHILVLMDNLPQAEDRLDLALSLAKQHGAHLVGLNVVSHPLLPLRRHRDADSGEAARALFTKKTAAAAVAGHWVSADVKALGGGVADAVNHYAIFADLVIVGQHEEGVEERRAEDRLAERVILGSGKPVLIVPYTGGFTKVPERVLIAWKTGREMSRTLSDSLPLLQGAGCTHVFEVNPSHGEVADMEQLRGYLAAHGVEAQVETSAITELKIGDILLNRVSDEGSDLLVMGAYAAPHFGTYALGDVARHVLKHMTVPVLMSH